MTFLCVFLPVVFILYYVIPSLHMKNGLLILASLLFYAYGEPKYVLLMLISIVMNYTFGRLLDSENERLRGRIVSLAVCANLSLLIVFKYLDMVLKTAGQISHREIPMANLALPIGISFFTFQALSYVIDVYRREVETEKNLFHVMLYISFFPQLIAGPIVKYHDIQEQIGSRRAGIEEIASGMRRFILGLAKKVLVSNVMAVTADALFAAPVSELNLLSAWTAALAYLFQIYFDFSGYSDMAVGISVMLNIKLPINFDSPYKALSIRDFWKRWHISLTGFLTKYIYIPLGGSKKGILRTYINTLLVFLISGIWHGANWTFILWGILHGLLSVLDRVFEKQKKNLSETVRWMGTFFAINLLWLLFRSDSITQWLTILQKMFTFENMAVSGGLIATFVLPEAKFLFQLFRLEALNTAVRGFSLLLFTLGSLGLCLIPANNYRRLEENNWLTMILAAIAFVWSFLCLSSESVFVYFNF